MTRGLRARRAPVEGGARLAASLFAMVATFLPAPSAARAASTVPPDAAAAAIRFTDVTRATGIDFATTSGRSPSTSILEVKGGGLALLDFDGDGDLDIFVPNGATLDDPERGPGARLYRNDGALRFTDVTAAARIAHRRWSFGAAVGDVDADGHDDVFIACFGPDVLLRNRGDGTFEDATAAAGLGDPRWGTSAAFADLDLDGDLDLCVCNYVDVDPAKPLPPTNFKETPVLAGPRGYPAAADAVYENLGGGRFAERSLDCGVVRSARHPERPDVAPGFGLNLAILDLTGDGRPDVFVGNDSQPNALFTASSPDAPAWDYADVGLRSGIAVNGEGSAQATMGIAIGDVDGNGRPDVFTTNFSSDVNTLHLNLDGRSFDDRTNQFGLGAPSRRHVGWAAGFFDFDHDADEDLLVVNGHVYPEATRALMDSDYRQPPLLMERVGPRFRALSEAGAWKLEPQVGRTAVFADLDQDGDVDAVLAGLNEPIRVLRNDHDRTDDWIVVVPRDRRPGVGNGHAVGAEIRVSCGGRVQRRWMVGGGPFQSNAAPEAHVGLGSPVPGAETADVEVVFPDGAVARRAGVARGSRVVVEHP